MIPETTPYSECYSGPNQLQVLDALRYEGAELEGRWFVA
jgi:hypothetical protein